MQPRGRTLVMIAAVIAVTTVISAAWSRAEDKKDKPYTVGGYRHGVSFFSRADYPETKPVEEGTLDFRHYHTYAETKSFLDRWAEEYTDIFELTEQGESFEGRTIYQAVITKKDSLVKDTDKPAMAIDANRHSGEVTSAECALWIIDRLLTGYGADPEITRLVDDFAIYVRVNNNPDGSELYLNTVQRNRSSVRPHDSDRDGLLDEDPGDDLDGDGFIRQMRVANPDSGNYIIDPRDPSGRLMKRVRVWEGDWDIYSEGIDNDGDGRYNEDGIGGLDLHRNYPENWRPEPGLDATGRGRTQFGAGVAPLSEPETRSFAMFLLTHPNVSVVNSMDTSVPMHLRGPSTSNSEERMYPADLKLFRYFDREGIKITGYPWAGDTYNTYFTRRATDPVYGDPTRPAPLFGHGPDFGYWYYGSIWYGDELWCSGAVKDYNGDGDYDSYDAMRWNDEALGGAGFKNWETYEHPQLGTVEIGGFNPKFFSQNPPTDYLEEWIAKQGRFDLFLAKHLPKLELRDVSVKAVDGGEYEVTVRFANTGKLPTALEQAKLVKIVRPDRVRLEFDREMTLDKRNPKVEITLPEIQDKIVDCGFTAPGEEKTARLRVKLNGVESAECTVHVLSTRGGHLKRKITLGGN